ncbi:MAG TPA: hypothetical protein VEW47_11295 [Candidatus Dormibacteraeota bacterium]|nr:hypothetical protein [Candidatus Dormibacteraeota bacterium]
MTGAVCGDTMNTAWIRLGCVALLVALVRGDTFAQVDVEPRTILTAQSSTSVLHGEEWPGGFGAFWFNRNHLPWEHTALRLVYAGIYADAELSYFAGGNPNTTLGLGIGGGAFLDGVDPYTSGERLSHQQFYGDSVNARVFVNQTIPGSSPLPINIRATYTVSGTSFRNASDTLRFTRPHDFRTQQLMAEFRIGGIEPGLTSTRGVELYLEADTNERTGFHPFGPNGVTFPAWTRSDRLSASLGGRIPAGRTLIVVGVHGGLGRHIDELSAWKLGGNMLGIDPFSYTLHGYYTRELLAESFVLANLDFAFPIASAHQLTGHLYGDYATLRQLDAATGETIGWHRFPGIGAGVGFKTLWGADCIIGYGYGIDAVRDGRRGGHEVGFAFEKSF